MKKQLLTLVLILATAGIGFSQSPEAVNYQAVARDAAGTLLNNQNLDVRIGIYSGVGGAVQEYEETHAVTTNQFGQFSLKIGQGTVVTGTFSAIGWNADEHHLKVEVDNGSGYVDLGTTQLVSVPYAMHASTADVAGPWELNGNNAFYNNGYVGIGTDDPQHHLHLYKGGLNYMMFSDTYTGPTSGARIGVNGSGHAFFLNELSDRNLFLTTNGTNRVAVTHDGLVGIGTNAPEWPLHLHSSTGTSYLNISDGTTGVSSGLRVGLSGSGNAYIINDEATKSLSLGTEGTTQLRIISNGHVGINELSPDQMLHIKQDAANKGLRIEHQSTTDYWENGVGTTTKNYKFYYNNLSRADISSVDGAYAQLSDRRLKKNIVYMEPVLDRVMGLKPATYNYIDNNDSDIRSTGFVAQEVAEVFPSLVRDMEGGYQGVVYDGFAVISIRAIQELNEELQLLKEEVKLLKEQVKQ